MYKGIPIRLTADLLAETLQARREWQDIFKVMKGKNLQPRLLYPAMTSFRLMEKLNFYRQSKVKRIQHHQTTSTTNAKGISLGRENKRRKRPTITNPKQLENGNRNMHIDNYLKRKWIKCPNQKTQTG